MVSLLHEGLLQLVRDQPEFAGYLLDQILGISLPSFTEVQTLDSTLNQLIPVEYRADAVVLFARDKPVFGVVIEAQLQPDDDKWFTWPVYVTVSRDRERCPFVVIVVTPNVETARWASRTVEIGGSMSFRPYVIGPEGIPKVTDIDRAKADPHLAVLSAMAHGKGDPDIAAQIALAAYAATLQLPEDQQLLYSALIDNAMDDTARKAFQMLPQGERYFSEAHRDSFHRGKAEGWVGGKAAGKVEGKAEGKAEALLKILVLRGLAISDAQRAQIMQCTDLDVLGRWMDRVLLAASVDELLT